MLCPIKGHDISCPYDQSKKNLGTQQKIQFLQLFVHLKDPLPEKLTISKTPMEIRFGNEIIMNI